jgi:hypothetical protein
MHLTEMQVSAAVYHRVLNTMYDELAPHMRRLMHLHQRVIGLTAVHFFDGAESPFCCECQ